MIFGSVCSGIEAASVAWHPLGWRAAFLSEIEPFPRAVLQHHYPGTPLHGDFTTIEAGQYGPIQLLVGGTPCQSFSIAGLRKGLGDDRGNLALEYLRLADRLRPRWLVWENVPGVLSSNGGRDFGSILGGMVELGYGFAYRVLDAQYVRTYGFFGAVPQRRRRVFVVGYLGDWRRAGAALFERESLLGNHPPGRKAREGVAATLSARTSGGGGLGTDFELGGGLCCKAAHGTRWGRYDWETETFVACTLSAARGRTTGNDGAYETGDVAPCLGTGTDPNHTTLVDSWRVRRLTPVECERLQGFPDGYTDVSYRRRNWTPDGPRYRALGNSFAVNVMRWIGYRIQLVEDICDGYRN